MKAKEHQPQYVQGVLLPQALPHVPSRFNIARLTYALGRIKEAVTSFKKEGIVRHGLSSRRHKPAYETTLFWREDASQTAGATILLPGATKLEVSPGQVVLQTDKGEAGPTLTYTRDGDVIFRHAPMQEDRQMLRRKQEQAELPWWDRSPELMQDAYVEESGFVGAAPDGGTGKKGTPYRHFTLAIPLSETETKELDVYAYEHWIGMVDRRMLHPNDRVRVRASVQYHEQMQPGGKKILVPWLRLFDVQRIR